MSNPNNVSDLPPLGGVKIETLTAISYSAKDKLAPKGTIWYGSTDGCVYISEKPSPTSPFGLISRVPTAVSNFQVYSIYHFENPKAAIIHWLGGSGQPGPVQIIYPGALKNTIIDEANRVVCYSSPKKSIFAIVTGLDVTVYEFVAQIPVVKQKFQSQYRIISMEICENSICYYANGVYNQYYFESEETVQLSQIAVETPFVYRVSPSSFLIGYKEFMVITGEKGSSGTMLQYDKENGFPNNALGYQDNFYIFFEKKFYRYPLVQEETTEPLLFDIPNVRFMTMVDDDLVVVTDERIKIIGSMPQAGEIADVILKNKSSQIDQMLSKLSRPICSQVVYDVFLVLWGRGHQHEALELISRHLLISNIDYIISLYPLLNNTNPVTEGLEKVLDAKDPKFIDDYLKFLSFVRTEYSRDNIAHEPKTLVMVNTALAQCYAAKSQCRQLDELIREGNLDMSLLQDFINKCQTTKVVNIIPAYAIYLANTGEPEKAFDIWHQLDDAMISHNKNNPMFITEASYAIQKFRDSDKLKGSLSWILKREKNPPELAINALLSPNHDTDTVQKWIRDNNLEKYKMQYCIYISTQKENKIRGNGIANETFLSLINILSEIDNDNFNTEKLLFTNAFKANGSKSKQEAKDEILNIAIEILRTHPESTNPNEAFKNLNDKVDKKVLYLLYQFTEKYDKAIDLFTSDGTFPIADIQKFCRDAPNPEKAFSIALNKIDQKDIVAKYAGFIQDNLSYMNVAEVLQMIPSNAPIKKVRSIISSAYNLLTMRSHNLDNRISITKSIIRDQTFEKSLLQTNYCTLQKNMKCEKCNQNLLDDQICVMVPGGSDGKVYHSRCKPTLK
ncbi:hypothetical protein GPJ56_009226 [Histomonas meleagridis]|uniref:uncharacterized protein n=1 Tax=Histomonas meleagridis TaxID=135588 RepID=UPI00355A2182|nr:hypothetical protein GPJ56_009226 [Histomonas meleagridis]KAH0801598.1 hypothetical protein GO595_005597 [Histomonas meleagridis]